MRVVLLGSQGCPCRWAANMRNRKLSHSPCCSFTPSYLEPIHRSCSPQAGAQTVSVGGHGFLIDVIRLSLGLTVETLAFYGVRQPDPWSTT
jgi:hypothetical protein